MDQNSAPTQASREHGIADAHQAKNYDKIVLVGHSLGAVLLRKALEPCGHMCDSPSHVEQFAEALLSAGLPLDDAINAVNTAAGARDTCVFVPVLVDNIRDEKEITYADATYVVRRVSVIALMRESRVGLISHRIEPRVQYSIAAKGTLPKRTLLRPRKRA